MRRRFFFPLFALAFALVFGVIVMLLWNAILPDLLHVGAISYWQAVGLLILGRLLFGRFGFGRHHCGHHSYLRDRWTHMSEEEQEKCRQEWRARCGWHTPPDQQQTQSL